MKIILAVDAIKPPLTGIGRYTWEFAQRLRHDPEIDQVRYYRELRWVDDPATLLNSGGQIRRKGIKIPARLRRLGMQYASQGHVFHGPNFFLPPFIERGIITVHDLSVFKFPETHPLERVRHFESAFLTTLGKAHHVITDSQTVRQEMIDYFGWPDQRITAIPIGVSHHFQPQPAILLKQNLARYDLLSGRYTLCVSTIEPRKRVESLITAYAQLPANILRRYPLVLVGDKGWHSEHQHQAIEAGERAGWLRYLGFVPESDLPALYSGARLFAYPSIYEGFGLPVAEAMACGVPVITSNRSCLPEIAAGAARLIDPDDIAEFTLSLEASLTDTRWRKAAIEQGLRVVQKYTWEKCVRQTVDLYKKVRI